MNEAAMDVMTNLAGESATVDLPPIISALRQIQAARKVDVSVESLEP